MGRNGKARIMELTSKVLDSKPDLAFFIAIPGLDENAANLSKQLNIVTIEAKNLNEASDKVREKLTEKGFGSKLTEG